MSGGPTLSLHITGSASFKKYAPCLSPPTHSLIFPSLVYLVDVKHSSASPWFLMVSAQVLFFLTSSKEPVTMLPFPFTQTRLELPRTKRTPHEGERENWNPLVKSVSVMYNNLGWTSPSSVVGVQMSHVKAPKDTPKTTEMLHSRKVWGFTVTPTFI